MGKKKGGGGGGGGGGGAPTFDPADVASETWEAMTARHASETATIEAHCASMTGKKDRDKKMRLEGEVRDRHYREIAEWESIHEDARGSGPPSGSASASSDDEGEMKERAMSPSPPTAAMARASVRDDGDGDGGPTITKAMKRRAKKEREEREREEAKEVERANAGPSDAARESDALKKKVRSIHWSPYDRVGVVNADP